MASNWWMFFVAGLIPLAIGFVWYGNMGFGKKWMNINGFTDEDLEGGNMVLIMGLMGCSLFLREPFETAAAKAENTPNRFIPISSSRQSNRQISVMCGVIGDFLTGR